MNTTLVCNRKFDTLGRRMSHELPGTKGANCIFLYISDGLVKNEPPINNCWTESINARVSKI